MGAVLVSQLSPLSKYHFLVYSSVFLSKKTQTPGPMMYCLISPCSTQNYWKTKAQSETVTTGHAKHLHTLQPQALKCCNDYFVRILVLFSNICVAHPGCDAVKVEFTKWTNKQTAERCLASLMRNSEERKFRDWYHPSGVIGGDHLTLYSG